jgi:AcrR family transcriptional regulator
MIQLAHENVGELKTTRALESEKKKLKIVIAAKKIVDDFGISSLTVKNVCKVAGISNGTFFHYFDSKENLIAAYMHYSYSKYTEQNGLHFDDDDFFMNIIELHCHNIAYTKTISIEFVRCYYNINNERLVNRNHIMDEEYSRIILEQLEKAAEKEYINSDLPLEEIAANICMVAKGVIFEWGLCGSSFNIDYYISHMLKIYIKSIASDTYMKKYAGTVSD